METTLLYLPRLEAQTTDVPWSGPAPDPGTLWKHDGEIIKIAGPVSRHRLPLVRGVTTFAAWHQAPAYWTQVPVFESGPVVADEPLPAAETP